MSKCNKSFLDSQKLSFFEKYHLLCSDISQVSHKQLFLYPSFLKGLPFKKLMEKQLKKSLFKGDIKYAVDARNIVFTVTLLLFAEKFTKFNHNDWLITFITCVQLVKPTQPHMIFLKNVEAEPYNLPRRSRVNTTVYERSIVCVSHVKFITDRSCSCYYRK